LETAQGILVVAEVKAQYFDGDRAIQNQIMAQVNVRHPAASDMPDDFIAAA
jgi:hypothetical protein